MHCPRPQGRCILDTLCHTSAEGDSWQAFQRCPYISYRFSSGKAVLNVTQCWALQGFRGSFSTLEIGPRNLLETGAEKAEEVLPCNKGTPGTEHSEELLCFWESVCVCVCASVCVCVHALQANQQWMEIYSYYSLRWCWGMQAPHKHNAHTRLRLDATYYLYPRWYFKYRTCLLILYLF